MNTQETFISHLVELRTRLIRALLAVVVIFVCLFPWAKDLYSLLANPLLASLPQGGQMIATDVVGVFVVPMKVAFLVAFLIALPYVLYQMWAFVAPRVSPTIAPRARWSHQGAPRPLSAGTK